MENAPVIFKVVKMEDNSVEEVSILNDERTTRVYQPYMTHNISDLDQVYCPTVYPVSSESNTDCKDRCNYILIGFYNIFFNVLQYIVYMGLFVVFLWPANPDYITPIPSYRKGQAIPQTLIIPRPVKFRKGCDDGLACLMYTISPIFNTSFGMIYPNYTTNEGKPVDYGRVLSAAMGVFLNSSCQNYMLHTASNIIYSERNDSIFEMMFEYMLYDIKTDLFLLQYNCKYEAASLVYDPFLFSRFNIDMEDYLQLPPISECDIQWEEIFNTSYKPNPPATPCNPKYSNLSGFMDFVYMVDFK